MEKYIITGDLKKHFENSPNKTRVWVNEAGEWSNFAHKLYPFEVSRAEALGTKTKPAATPPPARGEAPVSLEKPEGSADTVVTDPAAKVKPAAAAKPAAKPAAASKAKAAPAPAAPAPEKGNDDLS